MELSVIILNYNVRYFLEQCILSVEKALENIEAEIIVIDNNSSDDSCKMMKQQFPHIKLVENNENLGFPKGNNIGVSHAKGKFICILNPDTLVAEDTFEKVLKFADSKENLGIIGCKLIDGAGNYLPESKRGVPTPWVAFTKILGLYKIFPKSKMFNQYYAQHLQDNETGKVDILVGAFMLLKRDLYNEIGGFDENCFMYSDDIDLSYTVLQKGKNNYYFHETIVLHYKGESTVKDGTYMKRFQEAMNFFHKKHFNPSIFFSFFMKIGIILFSFMKFFQAKRTSKNKPSQYVLVSSCNVTSELYNKISSVLKIDHIETKDVFKGSNDREIKRIEFLLDPKSISNKEIIELIKNNKSKNFTYKIVNEVSNYLIGSDNSNDRGKIIKLIK